MDIPAPQVTPVTAWRSEPLCLHGRRSSEVRDNGATLPNQIILAHDSRLVRDLLKRVIEKSPSLQIAGETADVDTLPSMVERVRPQWVIVPLSIKGELPEVADLLLSRYPSTHILAVSTDEGQSRMRWVESHEAIVEGLSRDELIAVLGADRSRGWQDLHHLVNSIDGMAALEMG
jgi:chemotaxis response regulator CheB